MLVRLPTIALRSCTGCGEPARFIGRKRKISNGHRSYKFGTLVTFDYIHVSLPGAAGAQVLGSVRKGTT
jgi:hypothetical protein